MRVSPVNYLAVRLKNTNTSMPRWIYAINLLQESEIQTTNTTKPKTALKNKNTLLKVPQTSFVLHLPSKISKHTKTETGDTQLLKK